MTGALVQIQACPKHGTGGENPPPAANTLTWSLCPSRVPLTPGLKLSKLEHKEILIVGEFKENVNEAMAG